MFPLGPAAPPPVGALYGYRLLLGSLPGFACNNAEAPPPGPVLRKNFCENYQIRPPELPHWKKCAILCGVYL